MQLDECEDERSLTWGECLKLNTHHYEILESGEMKC